MLGPLRPLGPPGPLSQPSSLSRSKLSASDPRIETIDTVLSAAAEEGLCGTILIRSHDQVLIHKAYGWADADSGREMTIDTGFDIGSLVKPITGSGILKLEEQGKLSTADTLARFFPEAPADKRDITVMQVLTHTAGMRDVFGGDYQVVSRDWILDKIMSSPLIAAPGEQEEYSNSGYSLLAIIIEDVSGQSYEEFIRDEVLAPAGVHRLGYMLPGWTRDELAVGYRPDGERWGTPIDHPWAEDGPDGTCVATAACSRPPKRWGAGTRHCSTARSSAPQPSRRTTATTPESHRAWADRRSLTPAATAFSTRCRSAGWTPTPT